MSHRTKKTKLDNSLLDDDLLNQSQHDLNQLTENQFDSNSDNSLMAKYNSDLSSIQIPTLMNSSNKTHLNHNHNHNHISHDHLSHGHDSNHSDESALVQEQINAHNAANAAASAAVAAAAAAAAAAASVAAHYGLNNQSSQISTQDQDQNQSQQNQNQNIQQQQQQLIQQQYHLQQIQQQQQHLHQQQHHHHHQHLQNLQRQSSQQNYSDQYGNRSPIPIQPATNILRSKNDQLQLTNDDLTNNLKNMKSNDITNGMGDPSEYLITPMIEEQEFNNVDVLKEFVKEFGKKNEFGIAIAHSNSKAIYFTCELGGSYRKKKNKKVMDEFDQKQIGTKKIKCPFAMVAHFSKKKKFWTLKITQNRHNHPKLDPLINFPMLRKRSNQVNNTIKNLYLTGDKPSVIHQKLSSMFPDLVIKREDIYNEIRILKKKGLVPPSNELRARKSVTNSNEINIATNLQEQFQQHQHQHQHQQQQHIHNHHQQHQHQLQLQQQHHHQYIQQDQHQQQVADSLWPNLDDNKKDITNEAAAAVAAALKDTETAAVVAAAAQAQAQAQAQVHNQLNSQNQNQNQASYDGYVESYETKGDFGIDERLLGN